MEPRAFDVERRHLEVLNKHFRTTAVEKHPEAMIQLIIDEAGSEILGPNYSKERISQRKAEKIKRLIKEKLQKRYGKWINFTDYKMNRTDGMIRFSTNFQRVFRTEFGLLYGYSKEGFMHDLYVTSHCLDRFEERIPNEFYETLVKSFKRDRNTNPTTTDVLQGLIYASTYTHAVSKKIVYLDIFFGALILEDFDDLFVAKTILLGEMIKEPNLKWQQPLLNQEQRRDPDAHFRSFHQVLFNNTIKVKRPEIMTTESIPELLELSEEIKRGDF